MRPASGLRRPAINSTSDVLPAPEGPKMPMTWPEISRSISRLERALAQAKLLQGNFHRDGLQRKTRLPSDTATKAKTAETPSSMKACESWPSWMSL